MNVYYRTEIIPMAIVIFILALVLYSLLWISSVREFESGQKCKELNGTFISRSNVCVKNDAIISIR